jgi:mannosyltransferase
VASATLLSSAATGSTPLPTRSRIGLARLAALFGLVGFTVSVAGSWIPSFWGDEAASVMSAERTLPSLFSLLQQVDAVHGAYYLFLHFWIEFFGASEFSVRLPSSLAVGAVVAGTVVIADVLSARPVAIYAGVICTVLPRIGYSGAEARSYALDTAVAVWLTVLLALLVKGRIRGRLPWIGYAALLTAGVYLFLYLALLAIAHGLFLLASPKDSRMRRNWLFAVSTALVLAVPIIVLGILERQQIAFLGHRDTLNPQTVLVGQWFGNPYLASALWLLIAAAAWAAYRSWRRTGRGVAFTVLGLAWLLVPCILLALASVTLMPTYTDRYLSFSVPAAALLAAAALNGLLARRWMAAASLAVIVAFAAPTLVGQRLPYAKDSGSDWRAASEFIGSHARPGDAIIFDDTIRPSRKPRLAMYLYPSDYAGLDDVLLNRRFDESNWLWDEVEPLATAGNRLAASSQVWVIDNYKSYDYSHATTMSELERLGFRASDPVRINRSVIYEYTRVSPPLG